ncbi:MAG: UpxY family transcription antiterminator [Deltaproteobacteria bacterium]|nr:UpxY family transcription antiterminator [Deltaproteobacteria bacterium]
MKESKLVYSWYSLHTRSRFENVVYDRLSKKSFESFLPKIKVKSKRRDRNAMINVPLFPGYIFVRTDLRPVEHLEILKTIGAVRLLGNRKGPVSVPDENIDSLKIMVNCDATVVTGNIINKGEKVIVVYGPFAGLTGIFVRYKGQGRVVVNIDTLGQSASVEINQEDIEKLPEIL